MIKNLPAIQETQVLSLDWEDPLEKGMAIHSSIFAGKFHGQEELGGLSIESQRVRQDWATNTFTSKYYHLLSMYLVTQELWRICIRLILISCLPIQLPFLQSMDQGGILTFKSYYLRNLFHKCIVSYIPLMNLGKVNWKTSRKYSSFWIPRRAFVIHGKRPKYQH